MPLSWSEIRDRAVAFSREYREAVSEKSLSQQFWRDFFHVFGVEAKRVAAYEQQVKLTRKTDELSGDKVTNGWIDVFWRGKLLIEMKSAGQNLDRAFVQALEYFYNLKERDLPRFMLAMPPALLKAHQKLDAAVDKAYELHSGLGGGKKSYKTDAERVAFLFELYQRLTERQSSLLPTESAKKPRKSSKKGL